MLKKQSFSEMPSLKLLYDALRSEEIKSAHHFEYEALIQEENSHEFLNTHFKLFYKGLLLVEMKPESDDWNMNDSHKGWRHFVQKIKEEMVTRYKMDEWLELSEKEKSLPIEIKMKEERLERLKSKEYYDHGIYAGNEGEVQKLKDELENTLSKKEEMVRENISCEAYEALTALEQEILKDKIN